MKQMRAMQGSVESCQQTEGQKVPIIGRIFERCAWFSFYLAKNNKMTQFGVGRLEQLKIYYSEFAPVAREGGQERLADKYEKRMKQARALLIKSYARLAETDLEEKNYTRARMTIQNAEKELGTDVPEIMREKNRALVKESLAMAECGQIARAVEHINEMQGVPDKMKSDILSFVRQTARNAIDGRGNKNTTYTADQILEGALSR